MIWYDRECGGNQHNNNNNNNGNFICVFECTIVNLVMYRQFTNAAWDWIIIIIIIIITKIIIIIFCRLLCNCDYKF